MHNNRNYLFLLLDVPDILIMNTLCTSIEFFIIRLLLYATNAPGVISTPSSLGTWAVQYGAVDQPQSYDDARAVDIDSKGNVFIVGITTGSLYNATTSQEDQIFAAKLNGTDGSVIWSEINPVITLFSLLNFASQVTILL